MKKVKPVAAKAVAKEPLKRIQLAIPPELYRAFRASPKRRLHGTDTSAICEAIRQMYCQDVIGKFSSPSSEAAV